MKTKDFIRSYWKIYSLIIFAIIVAITSFGVVGECGGGDVDEDSSGSAPTEAMASLTLKFSVDGNVADYHAHLVIKRAGTEEAILDEDNIGIQEGTGSANLQLAYGRYDFSLNIENNNNNDILASAQVPDVLIDSPNQEVPILVHFEGENIELSFEVESLPVSSAGILLNVNHGPLCSRIRIGHSYNNIFKMFFSLSVSDEEEDNICYERDRIHTRMQGILKSDGTTVDILKSNDGAISGYDCPISVGNQCNLECSISDSLRHTSEINRPLSTDQFSKLILIINVEDEHDASCNFTVNIDTTQLPYNNIAYQESRNFENEGEGIVEGEERVNYDGTYFLESNYSIDQFSPIGNCSEDERGLLTGEKQFNGIINQDITRFYITNEQGDEIFSTLDFSVDDNSNVFQTPIRRVFAVDPWNIVLSHNLDDCGQNGLKLSISYVGGNGCMFGSERGNLKICLTKDER